jgi:hypothetical protein
MTNDEKRPFGTWTPALPVPIRMEERVKVLRHTLRASRVLDGNPA